MASLWQQHSTNTAEHPTSPSFVGIQRPLTPLILHRDWLDPSTSYPSADFGDVDFQSNHRDFASARPPSESLALSGLGIRNLDLGVDLASFDNSVPEVANIFDEARMLPNLEDTCDDEFQIFSRTCPASEMNTNFDLGRTSLCGSPWSFSVLTAPELARNDSSTDLDSSLSAEANNLAQMLNESDNDIALSFEELSAATGLSLVDFASRISATAEVALRNLVADGIPPAGSNEANVYDPFQFQSNVNDIAPKWFAADFALPFENSVFRNVPASWNYSCAGVNPADILPAQQPIEVSVSSPAQLPDLPLLSPLPDNDSVDTPRSNFQSLQEDVNLEDFSIFLPAPSQENRQLSDDEHSLFQSSSSSEYSPPLPTIAQKKTMHPRNSRRRITRSTPQSNLPVPRSPETTGHYDESTSILIPINLGTPVLDAHRGIDTEVLKAKAERYRLRNQGRDYDKRWLISFAGKLTHRGELMDEFRCYIKGCRQTNKRRDHILIHVGAHLDQRPFKCIHCPSRFLRKNECKRHELSHTGIRPYSCQLCPYPATTFVRQDLLKRHMKRTHGLQVKSEKENEPPHRPKKRARCD